MKKYDRLTWKLFNKFGGRKGFGLIALLYDSQKKVFYIIPKNREHIVFVENLLNISRRDVEERRIDIGYLIPVTIEIDNNEVRGFIVGVSGLELDEKLKVKHHISHLKEAYSATSSFLNKSEVPKGKKLEAKLVPAYGYE